MTESRARSKLALSPTAKELELFWWSDAIVRLKLTLPVSLVVLAGACQPATAPSLVTPSPTESAQEIVIEDWSAGVEHAGINELRLETFDVRLSNHGSRPIKIGVISLSSGTTEIKRTFTTILQPGEKDSFCLPFPSSDPLERAPGVDELECEITIGQDIGKVMCPVIAEKSITIHVPVAGIGYTEPVGMFLDKTLQETLPLTLVSWMEGDKALAGPFEGRYYTATAKPGSRFITLVFELRNDWTKAQKIPHIWEGDILTDKGNIYPAWQGHRDPVILTEYQTEAASEQEISALVRYSGGYELSPGESVKGRVVLEVPQDENPVEASIENLRPLIAYEGSH